MKQIRLIAAFLLAAVFAGSLVASRIEAQDAEGVEPLEAIGLYTFYNSGDNVGAKEDEPKLNPVVTALDACVTGDKTFFFAGGDFQKFYVRNVNDVENLVNGKAVGDANLYSAVGNAKKNPTKDAEKNPINDWIRAISVNPATKEVATLTQRGRVAIWNPETWELVKAWDVPEGVNNGTRAMKFSPNGKILAVCGYDASVRFYGYEGNNAQFTGSDFKEIAKWRAPSQSCTTLDFHSDRDPSTGRCTSTLLAVGGRGAAWVWNVATGDSPKVFELTDKGGKTPRRVRAVAFSPDGTRLAVAGDANRIAIWNYASNQFSEISLSNRQDGSPGGVSRKIFSMTFTDDNTLATGDSVNDVILWNVSTGEMKAIGKGLSANETKGKKSEDSTNDSDMRPAHSGTVAALVYVENEKDTEAPRTLLSGGFDTLVIRWKLP